MTKFEIISSLISLLAVAVAFYSLHRSKRNHDQLVKLEKVHAQLSERELAEYDKRDRDALKAVLSVRMVKDGSAHKFVITNQGEAEAKNIYFGLEQDNEHNPLVPNDFEQKTPYRILGPGDSYYLLASIPLSVRQNSYSVSLRWDNADGSQDRVLRSVAR
ncbi:hypothetical protein [Marinobacter nauticus]|uniref:hypothetical protein n=1 Tax=Marinobacter nauticus TaxID=2743 RepID=UPI0005A1D6FA|nr:hypothetical protein [Marinobacter nauticus]